MYRLPDLILINLLRSPEIDSQPGGVQKPYFRTGPEGYIGLRIRYLVSFKRLQIRAQAIHMLADSIT
jgi:hypothetical protein